ncbi:D-alanyl-D-alanine carboxypeptidase/D-alanyl-D-alanine-endopeptidase [Aquabacterium sp. OR-4]|uniref:D-alanyl-D-alanine carboxypeptidase/D-alanyl-D-alanine-endopeptidase n=1 Tax=Aquabacterium sp. OR-4 TaxID=2978127 RepID=UPI0021B190F7|nr:D-alanyl-D-alanine carboxypeptidase [Aquabacterium sp. OR-4]MDT7834802.1 D-alanyl-D-alanine carboxypeptidase [Aquabacterium sp. OR-4]
MTGPPAKAKAAASVLAAGAASAPAPGGRRQWLAGSAAGVLALGAGAWPAGALARVAGSAAPARAPGLAAPAREAGAASPARAPVVLPAPLRAIWASCGLPDSALGLHVQAVDGASAPLASLNAEHPYQLASTAKIVTTLAAFDLLGADYCWRTRAYLDGLLRQGRLLGDLVIQGGGDARLNSAELRQWFVRLHEQGVQDVLGDIVLDHCGFQLTGQDHASTPPPSPERPHHAWPDAFTLDDGRLRAAGDLAGGGAAVRTPLQASLSGSRIDSVVAQLWRASGGRLRGRVRERRISDLAPGTPRDGAGRPLAVWSEHRSPPLPELVREINKTSDNLAARNLMLSMSPGFPQRAATLPAARQRLAQWLQRQGLAADDLAVDTGSGLSRDERGKARAMVQLLRAAWRSPRSQGFVQSLPVAGVDGTLSHRMTRGQATGRAFLKTGTLLDTRALAGYVHGRDTVYAVAVLVNHPEAPRATPALDALVEWVAARA